MTEDRKVWGERHQAMRQALSSPDQWPQALEIFLSQHALLHAGEVSGASQPTYDDELWQGLTADKVRAIPAGMDHSIAWNLWHLARIEDITMNLLIAGTPQLLYRDGWYEKMAAKAKDTGNGMSAEDITELSKTLDVDALRAYRVAVGRRTREVVAQIDPARLKKKSDPARMQRVVAEGAVRPSEQWLMDYWGNLTTAGLLLMPPTRHNLVHLNESERIKHKLR